jgi:peroxiredoxin Q/BCP
MLTVGTRAPALDVKDHRGADVRSEALLGKGPLVVYFYPKDFTPGCTREACMFRDAYAELDGQGATIVGVSMDDDASHTRFAERYQLPFSLIADPKFAIARAWGVARPLGLGAWRVTYVIDRTGVIRGAFHHELSMSKHVSEVRELLVELRSQAA